MEKEDKSAFLICKVRGAPQEEIDYLNRYVAELESKGYRVYYPPRDTNQEDPTGGHQILLDNLAGMRNCREIHIKWNPTSQGSYFDLGLAFPEHTTKGKPIRLVNRDEIEKLVEEQRKKNIPKSFEQVLLLLDSKSRES